MLSISLSPSQTKILDQILTWFEVETKNKQSLTLGGYAGTGKTTLIGYLRTLLKDKHPDLHVAFCSYTGKAARMLRQKLVAADALLPGDSIGTIHMLIYKPIEDDVGRIIGWERKEQQEQDFGLLVVDEASMVNGPIWRDLLSLGRPILAVGDHGQLPPIEGSFNLMAEPELRLEEIFRQEAGSPIIDVSIEARTKGVIPFGTFGPGVKKLSREDPMTWELIQDLMQKFDDELLMLVGYNNTRAKINKAARELLEFTTEQPQTGDRVICLRNNHQRQVFNGMTGTLLAIERKKEKGGEFYEGEILLDGEEKPYFGEFSIEQFGAPATLHEEKRNNIDLFDFGYALTVHKAQGSQARRVIVFEERFKQMDDEMWRRWLYTAVTRASESLYIVG